MSDELKKRILITLAILLATRTLSRIPIPGVDPFSLSEFVRSSPAGSIFSDGAFSRATIGALGLSPYFGASGIVILVLYFFRRFRHGGDDRDVPIEFYTLCLAGAIVLLQSYGIAVFMENFPRFRMEAWLCQIRVGDFVSRRCSHILPGFFY